jgi:hypothetical protein
MSGPLNTPILLCAIVDGTYVVRFRCRTCSHHGDWSVSVHRADRDARIHERSHAVGWA